MTVECCLCYYGQVVEDMTEECSKYGAVVAIEIPHVGGVAAGVGFVFVKYGSIVDAEKVRDFSMTYTLVYRNARDMLILSTLIGFVANGVVQ